MKPENPLESPNNKYQEQFSLSATRKMKNTYKKRKPSIAANYKVQQVAQNQRLTFNLDDSLQQISEQPEDTPQIEKTRKTVGEKDQISLSTKFVESRSGATTP